MAIWTRNSGYGVEGRRKREHSRPTTRACSAALFPVCDVPSSLQIFLRSLLMRVLERSVMPAAMCCRLEVMVDCSCGRYRCRYRKWKLVEAVVERYQMVSARESIGGCGLGRGLG